MNGILCINKPQEYTSFDVIARLRGMSKTKRVGHSGTLDPMATGVLPIFFGIATKACDLLPHDDKRYEASFRLGIQTDTQDIFGTVTKQCESHVTQNEILNILPLLRGDIMQLPPMYSAIRINGQRLYDIARQGREVEREKRPITIHELSLTSFDEEKQEGTLTIACSKGTYIRTIIADIGDYLNVGGVMTALVRTNASVFTLADCITLEQAQEYVADGTFEEKLLPVERMFEKYPKIYLGEAQSRMFKNGVKLDLNRIRHKDNDGYHVVFDEKKEFLGLASIDREDMGLKIEKMFYRE